MAQHHDYLTVEEAATYVGVSVSRMYQLRAERRGPVSWAEHGRLVYPRADLELWCTWQRKRSTRGETVST